MVRQTRKLTSLVDQLSATMKVKNCKKTWNDIALKKHITYIQTNVHIFIFYYLLWDNNLDKVFKFGDRVIVNSIPGRFSMDPDLMKTELAITNEY